MIFKCENKIIKNLLNFLFILFLIFIARFIPHPPNFTIIIALTFYVALYFGDKSSLYVLISFILSDAVLGFHNLVYFTWASILIISLLANKLSKTYIVRILGVILSVLLFYIITNLGVYFFADHGADKNLVEVFLLGAPFLANSMICSLLFSMLAEIIIFYKISNKSVVEN